MDRHVNYSIVGLFVLFGLIGIFIFLAWYANTFDDRDYHRYTIHFSGSVNGLTNGGLVSYRGVEVGRILDIRFEKDRPEIIMVDVEVDNETPVTRETDAQLKPKGITGLAFIELVTENMTGPPLQRKPGQRYPVIVASSSALDRLFDDFPQIMNNVLKITTRLETLLDDGTMADFDGTISNVKDVSDRFALATENLGEMSQRIDRITSNVETMSVSSQDFIKRLSALTSRLDDLLARNENNVDRFLEKDLSAFSKLVEEMRETADSVSDLARELEQNPSAIIYKQQKSGVELPK